MKKDYNELKDLFIKNFNVSHLTIDLLDWLADVSKTDAENFILNKFYNEFSSVELTSILGENYIIDYYSDNTGLKTIIEDIENKLDFLLSHNKNYTKKQYYTIDDIKELIQKLK